MSDGGVPTPPKTWSNGMCPKGHSREHWRCIGVKRPAWVCTLCRKANDAEVAKNKRTEHGSMQPGLVAIPLACGHTCHYRRGSYTSREALFCFRCNAWRPQGVAA